MIIGNNEKKHDWAAALLISLSAHVPVAPPPLPIILSSAFETRIFY
jgi:hypothetical protein